MSIITVLSFSITFGIMALSILFKIAGKIHLTLPLLYLLLTATVLNKWASSHEVLAFIILFTLVYYPYSSGFALFAKIRMRKNTMQLSTKISFGRQNVPDNWESL